MINKPMVRNNICLNSHPAGCTAAVMRQIEYARSHLSGESGPRLVLVIGCSTGYGLSSRIAAAFGYGAATVGISLEKPASETKSGTPGFYNNLAFDREARRLGLASTSIDGDAFSKSVKTQAAEAIREIARQAGIPPKADLVIYSLASPVRLDPETGTLYRSSIKPIGKSYSGKTVDIMSGAINTITTDAATEEEIKGAIKVMGGEDWLLWIDALTKEDILSPQARTLAYTYIGPELSWAIYKNGTIGKAKEDLERACREINEKYRCKGKIAGAWVSVNKALVTRASAVIPIIPLYVSCLFKVMKEKNLHEGCIEQIVRLYRDRLYSDIAMKDPGKIPVDENGRIRLDDWEMREDVQKETACRMEKINAENLDSLADVAGFRHDFLEAHGFDVEGVDYEAEIDPTRLL